MSTRAFLVLALSSGPLAAEPVVPQAKIDLFPDAEFRNFTGNLNASESLSIQPRDVWRLADKRLLQITGKGWGSLRTEATYASFHLVLEYKWGEQTWGKRSDAARKSGVLIGDSLEVVLQEGATGAVVAGTGDLPQKRKRLPRTDAHWEWVDRKGFRGEKDLENPVGEWNRLEVVVGAKELLVHLNGKKVNKRAGKVAGKFALRSEGAELFVRRIELWPLGQFKEGWKPAQRSTDTGYSETGRSLLPRREPWSPEKSQAAWRIDGDYELQLVAAEPLVCDPADVVWDERGRMFVAEMRDYPFPPEHGPRLGRIRLLEDRDGDGKMDHARTWAENLKDVQGMLCFDGGLLLTSREGLLFLKDTNDDGVADQRTPLYTTNTPQHSQLQLASPRWRLDNTIHLNNGINGKEIHPSGKPAEKFAYGGFNLVYDPRTGKLRKESGVGQFGATLDDFGRVFFCSNRNPAMLEVLPRALADRNPFAGFAATHENIQESAARVYPLELSHTTSVAHAGTHTSACGLAVYRGDWMPDLRGNLFVCDPTAQLVTRNLLLAKGGSLEARRLGEKRDFLVSADEWSRPVNLRNGPDGALYLCDLYRRFIDHAIYFPEEFSKTNYMRAGFDHGRIWRLAPRGAKPRRIKALPADPAALVAELGSPIPWRRINSQRLLVAQANAALVQKITDLLMESDSPFARLHALWTLQGIHERTGEALSAALVLGALEDPVAGVVENAIFAAARRKDVNLRPRLAKLLAHHDPRVRLLTAALHGKQAGMEQLAALLARDAMDPWMRRAILSISPQTPGAVLVHLLTTQEKVVSEVLLEFSQAVAARGKVEDLARLLDAASRRRQPEVTVIALGLVRGLPRGPLKSLAALLGDPPASLEEKLGGIRTAVESAARTALDASRPVAQRVDALALVQGNLFPLMEKLIAPRQPPELQIAACRALTRHDRSKVADFFFARWDALAPVPRREALTLITGNKATTLRLMKKMKSGEISPALMPAMKRWTLGRSSDPAVKDLVAELFGKMEANRAKVVADYQDALRPGDAQHGKAVFEKAGCAACHVRSGDNLSIGPDIRDARNKPPEALLSDILDPNRAVEERWTLYQLKLRSGQETAGIISSETATTVELRAPGSTAQTIRRDQIASFSSTGRSLMPEGLEASISKKEMADLIAFLKARPAE